MLFRMFGIGTANAFAGNQTEGTVTQVKTCYWLKVNTKPVRIGLGDGAVYPHIICFDYHVAGCTYSGKCYVHWNLRCPVKGESITVYYENGAPERYAVRL